MARGSEVVNKDLEEKFWHHYHEFWESKETWKPSNLLAFEREKAELEHLKHHHVSHDGHHDDHHEEDSDEEHHEHNVEWTNE